jgi:putrescine aminotransferase
MPPDTYWPYVQKVCREHGIPIVADEVICGFGRTGQWFGHQTLGIEPDVVIMAKGLSSGYQPIGAVAVADHLIEEFFEHGGEFFHGYTYSGHPVASAVALENLRIMQTEDMVGNANRMEAVVRDKIGALADHPIVGEVRVKGLLGAIELVKDKKTRERFADWGRVGTICRDTASTTTSSCVPAGTRWCSRRRCASPKQRSTSGQALPARRSMPPGNRCATRLAESRHRHEISR